MEGTMDRSTKSTALLATIMGVCLLLVGCRKLDLYVAIPWFDDEGDVQTPTSMTAMWTDTVMYQTGAKGLRGLGGRFHFFDEDDKDAVRVEGTLTVYAFDAERDTEKPIRKYVFLPDQIEQHQSESSLGRSYSFWLPWDDVGGPQRKLSLIARFESAEGPSVMSDPAKVVLPGTSSDGQPARRAEGAVRQASANISDPLQGNPAKSLQQTGASANMRTFEIDVPRKFLRHTREATEQALSEDGNSVRIPVTPSPTEEAAEEPAASSHEPEVRYAPRKFPAQTWPKARPFRDRAARQLSPAMSPSRLQQTPRWGPASRAIPSSPAESQSDR
jgi:hypothetical protein